MARDPRYVHAALFESAMEDARRLLRWPISKIEMKGSLIRVDDPEQSVYFWVDVSPSGWIDEVSGQFHPYAGGESYDLALVPEDRRAEAEAEWKGAETTEAAVTPSPAPTPVRRDRNVVILTAIATITIAVAFFLVGLWVGSR